MLARNATTLLGLTQQCSRAQRGRCCEARQGARARCCIVASSAQSNTHTHPHSSCRLGRKGGLLHSISWCAPILERVSVLTSELGAARTHDRDCAVRQRVSVRVQVLQQEVDGGEGAAPASPGRASSRNRLSDKIALLGPRQQDAVAARGCRLFFGNFFIYTGAFHYQRGLH